MADKNLLANQNLPPKFTEDRPYEEWSRRISFWRSLTTIPAEKQGLAIASSLTGKALEAVLQLSDTQINGAGGFKNVMDKLDAVYKKNSLTQKIEDIEKFESLRRDGNSTVKEYISMFEKCVSQLKTHEIVYPKDVEGYKLLKGSNIPPNEEKMIRASCTDINYESVHAKLKAMYGDDKPANSRSATSQSLPSWSVLIMKMKAGIIRMVMTKMILKMSCTRLRDTEDPIQEEAISHSTIINQEDSPLPLLVTGENLIIKTSDQKAKIPCRKQVPKLAVATVNPSIIGKANAQIEREK